MISYALNSFWVWLLTDAAATRARAWPIVPMLFVTPSSPSSSIGNGCSADGTASFTITWRSSTAPLVVSSRGATVLGRADPPRRPAARTGAGSSRSAAAPATISPCSASSAQVDALELDARSARGRRATAGSADRTRRRCRSSKASRERHYDLIAALDVIEHIDDDRAALAVDRRAAQARRQTGHDRARAPVDVVGARRRQPSQRRYSKGALEALIEGSPLRLDTIGYFNSLLFPLAVAERMASASCRGKDDGDDQAAAATGQQRAREAASRSSAM